jgi:hypothetical protein
MRCTTRPASRLLPGETLEHCRCGDMRAFTRERMEDDLAESNDIGVHESRAPSPKVETGSLATLSVVLRDTRTKGLVRGPK